MVKRDENVDVASRAAEYALSFELEDVPTAVQNRMVFVCLDTVGVCIGGCDADYVTEVGAMLSTLGRTSLDDGGATTFATGDRRDVATAVLLNAAGGTSLELDEGNQRSAHMGIHTVPPALAAAEHHGASGREVLAALIAGYEVGARLGDVIRPMRKGLHPHGGWAPVSAAVATGRLLDLREPTLAEAIRIAVNPFIVGHWNAALEGATVRNFYTGLCCQHGIMAVALAAGGTTGVDGAVSECLLPYTAARDTTPDLLTPFDTFGDNYYLETSYVKLHAACRYAHAPLDALTAIQEEVDIDPEFVEEIRVETFKLGTLLDEKKPDNVLSAKFSTPFALATRLATGQSGTAAFTPKLVADKSIRRLADRVDVVATEDFESRASDGKWGARVAVELADGTTHSETVIDARGGGDNPFSQEEVYEKFDGLVGRHLSEDQTVALRENLLDITSVDNVATLFSPLR